MLLTVGKEGSIIEKLREMLEEYMKRNEPEYYPPVENLLDLIYEHYTENNPAASKTTVAGRAAKEKEKEMEKWLRGWMVWKGWSRTTAARFRSGRRSWTGRGACAVSGRRLLLKKV